MKKRSLLSSALSFIEVLGAVTIIITIAIISVISVKDTVSAGQRAAAQRELQSLNTSLYNFKAAGGVIPENATVSSALELLQNGTLLGGSNYLPLTNLPELDTTIAGEPYGLAYDPTTGFSYAPSGNTVNDVLIGSGTVDGVGAGGTTFPFDITDPTATAQALVDFADMSPNDPNYSNYLAAFNSAKSMNTLPNEDLAAIDTALSGTDGLTESYGAWTPIITGDVTFDPTDGWIQTYLMYRSFSIVNPPSDFFSSYAPGEAGKALNYLASNGVNMANSKLSNLDLNGLVTDGKNFSGGNFVGSNVTVAQLNAASSLSRGNLSGLNLIGLQLSGENMAGVDFSGASIELSQLNGASSIIGASLAGLNLSGWDTSGVWLEGVNFTGTNVTGEQLNAARDITRANLSGLNLAEWNTNGKWLAGVNLSNATITGAQLSAAAYLGQANLSGLNMSGFNANNQYLRGANFSNTRMLTAQQLVGAQNGSIRDISFVGSTITRAELDAALVAAGKSPSINCTFNP